MNLSLQPGDIGLVTGDYGMGKSTLVKAWALSLGRGAFWCEPNPSGGSVDFSDIAKVVHNGRDMEKAAQECAFVVWPAPPLSGGAERRLAALDEFCRVAMQFREAVVVIDGVQNVLPSKFLRDAPPHFQDFVELGHKAPLRLAKLFVAHRLAQIPLNLGGGAYRVSFRPFPGDDDALVPFFGREGVDVLKRCGKGEFGYWSQATGARLPLKLDLGQWGPMGPSTPERSGGGSL